MGEMLDRFRISFKLKIYKVDKIDARFFMEANIFSHPSTIRSVSVTENYPARALRALGLLLADGAPTVGGGKTF